VNQTDDERPDDLSAREHAQRWLRVMVRSVVIVRARVRVRLEVPQRAGQVHCAEDDQENGNGHLHRKADTRRNDDAEENDGTAHGEDRSRVTEPPEHPDRERRTSRALATHYRRYRDDVIRIRGVAHAEEEAEPEHRNEISHAASP
jgi:hypothetical protein